MGKKRGQFSLHENKAIGNWRKRSPVQVEYDRMEEAAMYLKGIPAREIHQYLLDNREYEISLRTVYEDIKQVREQWKESYLRDYDAAKSQELARIDELEREYWDSYRRSLRDKEEKESESKQDEQLGRGGKVVTGYSSKKARHKVEKRDGNPKYLEGIERCIQLRAKILGLDEPKKVQIDWRSRAREEGIDPDTIKADLVNQFVSAAEKGLTEGADNTESDEE